MIRFVEKAFFFVLAGPAVLRAAGRLCLHRRQRIDTLADTMRAVTVFRWPVLRHPAYLAATVSCLLWILPPFSYGRCYKRSLLLLDLWSRCGLAPTLHLGAKAGADHEVAGHQDLDRQFHAWVTTSADGPWTSDNGHRSIWSG